MNVMELFVKVGVDKSDFDKGIGNVESETKSLASRLSSLGSGIGSAMGTVASGIGSIVSTSVKVGTAAMGAAATGVAAITKMAVSGYGELEQLRIGAEKIFSGMDFSQITTDANNAFKELGMSANDYYSSINQAGATFAQTMGAEEGYNTARRGMLAISDYATGTGKSISELTTKYQMITRSASTYQSIADQFSGILPQTSSDFLEQAQAAGLLSTEYTKLTEVPVDEYQKAVTAMLEEGVAALNLTDNTAMEAESTITGSIGMLKAAWTNLVVGLADPQADLDQLIDNVTDSATATASNIVPTISRALTGIGTATKKLVPVVTNQLPGLIKSMLPNLLSAASELVDRLVDALPDLASTIVEELPGAFEQISDVFSEGFPDIIDTLFSTISDNSGDLTSSLNTVIDAIGDGLVSVSGSLAEYGPDILENLLTGITDSDMLEDAGTVMENLGQALLSSVDVLSDNAGTIIDDIIGFLVDNAGDFGNTAATLVEKLGTAIGQNASSIITGAVKLVTELGTALASSENVQGYIRAASEIVSGIVEAIPDTLGTLVSGGKDIIDGLADGAVQGAAFAAGRIAGALISSLVDFFSGDSALETILNLYNFTLNPTGYMSNKLLSSAFSSDTLANFNEGVFAGLHPDEYAEHKAAEEEKAAAKAETEAAETAQGKRIFNENSNQTVANAIDGLNLLTGAQEENTNATQNNTTAAQENVTAIDGIKTAATEAGTAASESSGNLSDMGEKAGEAATKVSETTGAIEESASAMDTSAQKAAEMGDGYAQAALDIETFLQSLSDVVTSNVQAFDIGFEFATGFADGIGGAGYLAEEAVNAIVQTITDIINAATALAWGWGFDFSQQYGTGINDGNSFVTTAINTVVNTCTELSTLSSESYGWGNDLMSNFAQGISDAYSQVEGAVSSVASLIASYMEHSVPEEGPLSDDDKWTADMMDNFIGGIEGKRGELQAEIENVARDMDFSDAMTSSDVGGSTGQSADVIGRLDAVSSKLDRLIDAIQNQTWELDGETVATSVNRRLGDSYYGAGRSYA